MKHVKSLTIPSRALSLGGLFAGLNAASLGLWVTFVVETLKDAISVVGSDRGDPEDIF